MLQGEIAAVDPLTRRFRVGTTDIAADAMLIALGASLDPGAIPGLAEGGHNLYSLAGALAIQQDLARLAGGRIVILTAAPLYKCPAAPYEAAMLVQDLVRRRGVPVEVALYAAEPGPMGTAGPDVSRQVRAMVEGQGISYAPDHQVASVDPARRVVHFTNGASADYTLLMYVPPHRAPSVLRDAGMLADSGWVAVDRQTLATGADGVFAIGDATGIPLASGKLLPKAGVFAHGQAEVVAENLASPLGRPGADPPLRWEGGVLHRNRWGTRRLWVGRLLCDPDAADAPAPAGPEVALGQGALRTVLAAPTVLRGRRLLAGTNSRCAFPHRLATIR